MLLRFTVVSALSAVLYGLLAHWSNPTTVERALVWAAVCVLYVLAVRAVAPSTTTMSWFAICAGAIVCRAAMLTGPTLDAVTSNAFLQGPTPLSALELSPAHERYMAVVADLASLALAPGLLRAARVPLGASVLHALNPLVIHEVAGHGRLEAVAIFFLLLSIRLSLGGATKSAAAAYGACLTGPLFLAATLPAFFRPLRGWLVLSLSMAAASFWLVYPGTPWQELLGWPVTDTIGASLFPAATALLAVFVTRHALVPLLGASIGWVCVAIRYARGDRSQLPQSALMLIGAFLFLAPQALPWSFLPIAYLAAHSTNPGWIVLTMTAPVTYWALQGGSWNFWTGFVQYFPAYAGLIYFWLGRRPERAPGRRPKSAIAKRLR